jgi:flavodoxin
VLVKTYMCLNSGLENWLKGLLLKILIVFYSKTGNARWVAQTVAGLIGADVHEVFENRRSRVLSLLSNKFNDVQDKATKITSNSQSAPEYDLIIVGTPVWASRPTPTIINYLLKNDLSGKKVAVFFTQGNSKPQAIEETKALMPNSNYLGEIALVNPLDNKEECEKQITTWCKTLIAT